MMTRHYGSDRRYLETKLLIVLRRKQKRRIHLLLGALTGHSVGVIFTDYSSPETVSDSLGCAYRTPLGHQRASKTSESSEFDLF